MLNGLDKTGEETEVVFLLFVFKRKAEGQNRNGLDTALCTDPEHGSQRCVSDCFPFA